MKRVLLTLVCVLGLATAGFSQKKAVVKSIIKTPNLQCEACKNRIEKHLFKEDGISSVKADYRKHTVTVVYITDRTNIENIKTSLANRGYDADDVTADEAYLDLPKTCQHMTAQSALPAK